MRLEAPAGWCSVKASNGDLVLEPTAAAASAAPAAASAPTPAPAAAAPAPAAALEFSDSDDDDAPSAAAGNGEQDGEDELFGPPRTGEPVKAFDPKQHAALFTAGGDEGGVCHTTISHLESAGSKRGGGIKGTRVSWDLRPSIESLAHFTTTLPDFLPRIWIELCATLKEKRSAASLKEKCGLRQVAMRSLAAMAARTCSAAAGRPRQTCLARRP